MRIIIFLLVLGVAVGQESRPHLRRRNHFARRPQGRFNPIGNDPNIETRAPFDRPPPPESFRSSGEKRTFIKLNPRPSSLGNLPLNPRPEYNNYQFSPVEQHRTLTEDVALSDGDFVSLGHSKATPPGLAQTDPFDLSVAAPDAPYLQEGGQEEVSEVEIVPAQENEVESKLLLDLLSNGPEQNPTEDQDQVNQVGEEEEATNPDKLEKRVSEEGIYEPHESIVDTLIEANPLQQEFSETEQTEYGPYEPPQNIANTPFYRPRQISPVKETQNVRPIHRIQQQGGEQHHRSHFRHTNSIQQGKKKSQPQRYEPHNYQSSNIYPDDSGSTVEHAPPPSVREAAVGVVTRRRPYRPPQTDEYPPAEVNQVDPYAGYTFDAPEDEEQLEEEKPDRLTILLQDTTFHCQGKKDGYYADEQVDCEVFHFCQDNVKHSWLCPNSASFHQVHLICLPRSEDNICSKSSKFHFVNEYLYKESADSSDKKKLYMQRYYPEGYTEGIAVLEERQAISENPQPLQQQAYTPREQHFQTKRRPTHFEEEPSPPQYQVRPPLQEEEHNPRANFQGRPQQAPSQEYEYSPFSSPYQSSENQRGYHQRVRPGASFLSEEIVPSPNLPAEPLVRRYRQAPPPYRRHSLFL